MRTIYTFLFVLLIFIATPTLAEQESPFTGGMKHGKLYKSKKPMVTTHESNEESESGKKNRVWNKYKSLAAGTEEPTEKTSPDNKKSAENSAKEIAAVTATKPNETPAEIPAEKIKPSGMGMLIQKYQQNKEQRQGIRSLSFSTPEALKPKTKTITKPQQ